jgi:uncharacterized protein YjbJ (UPF0337 family)
MAEYKDDSVGEEASAFGERAKGNVKAATGAATGNERLRAEGNAEAAEGNARQERNNVFDESDGAPGRSVEGRGRLVTGLYRDRDTAARAYNDLTTTHGYKPDDVSVVMSDDTRKRYFGDDAVAGKEFEEGSKALEGMGVGSAIGGTLGAIVGALAAIGTSVVFPGVGLIVAGPLAAALAGAGAGGATGGLLGALVGAGIPEERAVEYERGINVGGILLGTHARDDEHAAALERDYANYGATDIRR